MVGAETKIRKYRVAHQIVSMLLIFGMGLVLGWVLKGGQTRTEDAPALGTVAHAPELPREPAEAPDDGDEAPETPEVSDDADALGAEPEPPGDETPELAPAVSSVEDIWPARHLFVAVNGTDLNNSDKALLSQLKPGGVVLLDENIENRSQTIRLVGNLKAAVGLGTGLHDLPLVAVAQEGGEVNRLNLEFAPGAPELAAGENLDAAREAGRQFASSCKDRGIAVLLAPVLDVLLPGAPEAIQARSFGKNRQVVEAMGLAFADGVMQSGIAPIVKHYPGYGAARTDPDTGLAVIELERSEDLAMILYPFAEAVLARVPGMMVGHIAVPRLDEGHPRRPASLSPLMVREFLRNRWNFGGVIISDDISLATSAEGEDIGQVAVQALAAGCDALVVAKPSPETIRAICAAIEAAVAQGVLERDQLEASKRRLDALQAWLQNPSGLTRAAPELSQPAAGSPEPPDEALPEVETPETQEPPESPAEEPVAEVAPERADSPAEGERPLYHRVAAGDTLTRLALRYGVSIDELKRWNNLESEKILLDQRLRVSPPE